MNLFKKYIYILPSSLLSPLDFCSPIWHCVTHEEVVWLLGDKTQVLNHSHVSLKGWALTDCATPQSFEGCTEQEKYLLLFNLKFNGICNLA